MEIKGKVIQVLQIQEGTSQRGNSWRKQGFVLETEEKYPKKIYFELWNDSIDKFPIAVGQSITAEVDADSREFNSRWYTTLTAYKVEVQGVSNTAPQQAQEFPQEQADASPF